MAHTSSDGLRGFDDGRVPQSRCLQEEDEGVVSERADDSHLFSPFSLLFSAPNESSWDATGKRRDL